MDSLRQNDLATALNALAALFSLVALVLSFVAYRRALVPSEARELIRETEDVLEKLHSRMARESMRTLRSVKKRTMEEPAPEDELTGEAGEAVPAGGVARRTDKAELWRIVRQRGMVR